jgi:hypothetical protein
MMTKDGNGNVFISLKWTIGVLATMLIMAGAGWANQRHQVEADILIRLAVVERVQARVLERLDANHDTLLKIYGEIREHRATGK